MKVKDKVFLIITLIITLILTGCGNSWNNKIQASDFKLKDDYIIGKLKNVTDKAYDLKITFSLKSGSIEEDEICHELIKPKQTLNIECISTEHEGYKVKIKDIKLDERKIKKLKSGEIDIDTFEYYFTNIYKEHLINITGIGGTENIKDWPYISEIEYNEAKDTIKISGRITENLGTDNLNYFAYTEEFDTTTGDITDFAAFIRTNDEEFLSSILTKIAFMKSFNKYKSNSIDLLSALKHESIGLDRCLKVGTQWCVSSSIDDTLNSYFISEQ